MPIMRRLTQIVQEERSPLHLVSDFKYPMIKRSIDMEQNTAKNFMLRQYSLAATSLHRITTVTRRAMVSHLIGATE